MCAIVQMRASETENIHLYIDHSPYMDHTPEEYFEQMKLFVPKLCNGIFETVFEMDRMEQKQKKVHYVRRNLGCAF